MFCPPSMSLRALGTCVLIKRVIAVVLFRSSYFEVQYWCHVGNMSVEIHTSAAFISLV